LGVVAAYAVSSATAQAAVLYESSDGLVVGIGDQIDTLFDKISLGPYESTFVAPQLKDLNPLTFLSLDRTPTLQQFTRPMAILPRLSQ
jgi:hypothetical protein